MVCVFLSEWNEDNAANHGTIHITYVPNYIFNTYYY